MQSLAPPIEQLLNEFRKEHRVCLKWEPATLHLGLCYGVDCRKLDVALKALNDLLPAHHTEITFSAAKRLDNEFLEEYGASIVELDLRAQRCFLQDDALDHLLDKCRNVRRLSIESNFITSAGLAKLGDLSKLTFLSLNKCSQINEVQVPYHMRDCPVVRHGSTIQISYSIL